MALKAHPVPIPGIILNLAIITLEWSGHFNLELSDRVFLVLHAAMAVNVAGGLVSSGEHLPWAIGALINRGGLVLMNNVSLKGASVHQFTPAQAATKHFFRVVLEGSGRI
jgi:hypothetical protein